MLELVATPQRPRVWVAAPPPLDGVYAVRVRADHPDGFFARWGNLTARIGRDARSNPLLQFSSWNRPFCAVPLPPQPFEVQVLGDSAISRLWHYRPVRAVAPPYPSRALLGVRTRAGRPQRITIATWKKDGVDLLPGAAVHWDP